MFRSYAHADRMRHQASHSGDAYRHPELPWRFRRTRITEQSIECLMRTCLHPLSHARRELAPALHSCKKIFRHSPLAQGVGQQVRGRDCVLDRQIDSHPSHRRHRMGSVSDTQQPWQMPFPQTVQLHREQFDLIPVLQFVNPIAEKWCDLR